MVLEEPTGMNTNFTEGCWVRFILSGVLPYKTPSIHLTTLAKKHYYACAKKLLEIKDSDH